MTRFEHRENRRASRLMMDSKPVLVEALRNMQSICPPRVSKQRKADLERIVRNALWRDDNDPTRLAMQAALRDARKQASGSHA
ncbi:hypothetical protein HLH34_18945 [Gluconacetobacter azotocaptans]|uniref:Uncharacterized protein n=1 Tax=Gluconacetobacter azotocaptans TaxID=142834 RepID=A0A7W4JW66_9PROT|nr:hypothetical protein [Gluconacetobacter azotocaptans]MBB2192010.1 hypothetical protein [Gluconacetobacter azotocaptans]GBQ33072.1 hypothetical protein AA13594_2536 [Gluconacetobacter azotocaptans DSM 13594]